MSWLWRSCESGGFVFQLFTLNFVIFLLSSIRPPLLQRKPGSTVAGNIYDAICRLVRRSTPNSSFRKTYFAGCVDEMSLWQVMGMAQLNITSCVIRTGKRMWQIISSPYESACLQKTERVCHVVVWASSAVPVFALCAIVFGVFVPRGSVAESQLSWIQGAIDDNGLFSDGIAESWWILSDAASLVVSRSGYAVRTGSHLRRSLG